MAAKYIDIGAETDKGSLLVTGRIFDDTLESGARDGLIRVAAAVIRETD